MWCVALFDMVHFAISLLARMGGRVWRGPRGAVRRVTHPNLISHRRVGVCLRVPHTPQVLTAAQLQVALFARALGCSSLAGTRFYGWASWASGDVTRAKPSCGGCEGVGTSFARACVLVLLVGGAGC